MTPIDDSSASARIADLATGVGRVGPVGSARDRVFDTIAVGLSGSATAFARSMRSAVLDDTYSSAGRCSIWGCNRHAEPPTAALLNAAAVHAEDYDDTHTGAVVHGSSCVVPAAWAAAESANGSLADLFWGVLVGWEVAARIGLASRGAFHRRGMHPTSIAGIFGAAASTAAVRRTDTDTVIHALGLAGSAVSGLNAYLQNGSNGKALNPAYAAQAGYQAAVLAQSGVTGPPHVLEGTNGVFAALADSQADDPSDHFATLGDVWEIENVSTKPYPACHFAHAAVDAARRVSELGVRSERIRAVEVHLPPETFALLCEPWEAKLAPTSTYGLRFSLPWLVSLALVDGDLNRASFTDRVFDREEIHSLARRVKPVAWTTSPYPRTFPGRIRVHLASAPDVEEGVLINRGHPNAPMSEVELIEKFHACADPVIGEPDARRVLDLLNGRADVPIRELSASLNGGLSALP